MARGATIARALAAIALVAAMLGCDATDARPPSVLLITVDTLRADRLGAYGYRLPTSPSIDRLAAQGIRFADCSVQWPKTWPSMASMLTGAYPKTTGIKLQQRRLPDAHLLLPEVFRAHGYRTGAVVANVNLGQRFGFGQGFDHFVESWKEAWEREAGAAAFINAPGKVKRYTDARTVTDQGLAFLSELDARKPFFLWLHYMDPHGPYLPPEPYQERFVGEYPAEPVPLTALPEYQRQTPPGSDEPIADLAFYRAQYDREVRYLDDELGRLMGEITALGVKSQDLLLALTADHGESLSEHGYLLEHGLFPYQAAAHVPLILVQEGRLPAGRVVEAPVGLVDLPPTLLDLAGIEVPATFEGRSLRGLLVGGEEAGSGPPDHVFMESGYREATQLSVREGSWKLIQVRSPEDRALMKGESWELYDLHRDPAETENIAAQHPAVVDRLGAVLAKWYQGGPRWTEGEAIDPASLSPAEREMLRALGYVE